MRTHTLSREEPPSASEAVARLRLWFSDRSLRDLETRGVLDWDRDEHVVRKGRYFDAEWDGIPR